jgi:hypothetical protein
MLLSRDGSAMRSVLHRFKSTTWMFGVTICATMAHSETMTTGVWAGELVCNSELVEGAGRRYVVRTDIVVPSEGSVFGRIDVFRGEDEVRESPVLSGQIRARTSDGKVSGSFYRPMPETFASITYSVRTLEPDKVALLLSGPENRCIAEALASGEPDVNLFAEIKNDGAADTTAEDTDLQLKATPEVPEKLEGGGPSQSALATSMTQAAAYQMCNPTDPRMAAELATLKASGLGEYRAEGDACKAYMLGTEIGVFRFAFVSGGCVAGSSKGQATCEARMQLQCQTPTDHTGLSGDICTGLTSSSYTFTGKGEYRLDQSSGQWKSVDLVVVGQER